MIKNSTIRNIKDEQDLLIEMQHNFKDKLNIAELVLKTLGIKYQIKVPKTHTSKLRESFFRKSLEKIHDDLINLETSREDTINGSN